MKVLSGEIRKGDFVIISSAYSHIFGFFLKEAATIHFYSLSTLSRWLDGKFEKPPRVEYLRLNRWRYIAKYDINLVTDTKVIEMYVKSIEALKKLKIIV